MKIKNMKKMVVLGMVSFLLTGCGNVIPELTEEEASLMATYVSDVVLGHSKVQQTRLMDTEAETVRRETLSEKVKALQKKVLEGGDTQEEATETGVSFDGTETAEASVLGAESIAGFVGLDGLEVSYDGYEIAGSYAVDSEAEWEPTFDATSGKNLLIVKLKVTNVGGAPAVADVLSKDMMFSINGDNGIGGMALMTMLLNDFAFAQDEIGAGESKQYVLITQVDESITATNSLSLRMKKGGESMVVKLK